MNISDAEIIETELFLKYKTKRDNIFCGITKKGIYSYSFHTVTTDDEKEKVKNSRKFLLEKCGFDSLITLKQIHSDIIRFIDEKNINDYLENSGIIGDGLLTNLKRILLGISTADCVPIIFISQQLIGITHAGWRGIKQRIHTKMLTEFKRFMINPEGLEIIIGPHNRICSYEVGEEMLDIFQEKYFSFKDNKIFLSLEEIIIDDLLAFGVTNISSLKLCSFCNNDIFYSYRKGEESGRNLSFVGIQA